MNVLQTNGKSKSKYEKLLKLQQLKQANINAICKKRAKWCGENLDFSKFWLILRTSCIFPKSIKVVSQIY